MQSFRPLVDDPTFGSAQWTAQGRTQRTEKDVQTAIVVSTTSWTPDEDFAPLLDALDIYDAAAARRPDTLPRVILVVTGKGPLRSWFEAEVARREPQLTFVRARTAWLERADYPRLLGASVTGHPS